MKLGAIWERSNEDTTLAPRWHSDRKYSHLLRATLDHLSTRSLLQDNKVETASNLLLEVIEALEKGDDSLASSIYYYGSYYIKNSSYPYNSKRDGRLRVINSVL